jgi:hypothetical protein
MILNIFAAFDEAQRGSTNKRGKGGERKRKRV